MKKFKPLYFLPAILMIMFFGIDFFRYGDAGNIFDVILWLIILFMVATGIMMSKGKKLGAYLGMAFGVLSIAYDIIYHKINGYYRELPLEYICVPLIIYYIYCLIAINAANTGAYDTKDTLIKSYHDKMSTLQERFWSDK
ncbi:MAG: hypothetical protein IJO54_02240 [Oscillospiraceae bacterium]|nr:hypothetical protein [Oscillospiraceae bacterium]